MFTGEETFVLDGKNTSDTMLGFWQWTLSCIHDGTTRGSFEIGRASCRERV